MVAAEADSLADQEVLMVESQDLEALVEATKAAADQEVLMVANQDLEALGEAIKAAAVEISVGQAAVVETSAAAAAAAADSSEVALDLEDQEDLSNTVLETPSVAACRRLSATETRLMAASPTSTSGLSTNRYAYIDSQRP